MHWTDLRTNKPFEPDTLDRFGFVYIIKNTKTKKEYIGCKQFFIGKDQTPSKWQSYTGSSKYLNADIEKIGKKHFTFEVIDEFKNKRSLGYYELFYQMKFNVLDCVLEGTDEPAFYNNYVGGKFYRPVQGYRPIKKVEEAVHKITYTDQRNILIDNLTMFAQLNNYDKSHLCKVKQGKRKRHKDVVKVEIVDNV
tara:strand:+ start:50 stop:631 length:582 start_codon:yes stop_codon:yes gene_type:complete